MTTIQEQFLEIRDRLMRAGTPPVRVSFSSEGYLQAMKENVTHDLFTGALHCQKYMGLPYSVRSDQRGPIGLHTEFEQRRGAVTLKLGFDATSGHVTVDGKPHGEPISVMQVLGEQLSAAQLCDIIRAWLDSDDATHWGEFEKALDRVVVEHGRFE